MTTLRAMESGYGTGAASYNAAGAKEGISRLVDAFYDVMDTAPEARVIRAMHERDRGWPRRCSARPERD